MRQQRENYMCLFWVQTVWSRHSNQTSSVGLKSRLWLVHQLQDVLLSVDVFLLSFEAHARCLVDQSGIRWGSCGRLSSSWRCRPSRVQPSSSKCSSVMWMAAHVFSHMPSKVGVLLHGSARPSLTHQQTSHVCERHRLEALDLPALLLHGYRFKSTEGLPWCTPEQELPTVSLNERINCRGLSTLINKIYIIIIIILLFIIIIIYHY